MSAASLVGAAGCVVLEDSITGLAATWADAVLQFMTKLKVSEFI